MIAARTLRLDALFLPGPIVALAVTGTDGMLRTAALVLFALWITMCGGLVALALDARKSRTSVAEKIDVLTANGAVSMWSGAGAIVFAMWVGWASLAVLGVLGMGTVCLAATWLALVTGSNVPWRRATIERTLVPASALEGDAMREQIHIANVHIPAGMRLFVRGRALPHRPESRYVVDSIHSGAELELASELGPAPRGEHRIPPLELWLGDVLGLVRTAVVHRGDGELVVLPRPMPVDQVHRVLGKGGDDALAVPVHAQPTEGTFRMREYTPGDDTRRIHWVRSLAQDKLVVRLPDEIPPAEPSVRIVLDNDMVGSDSLDCEAATQMLDALVSVWLGVGEALAKEGVRVTLVTAIKHDTTVEVAERSVVARATREAVLRFGARVTWQNRLALGALLAPRRDARQIIVSCRPRRLRGDARDLWIVVPDVAWTHSDPQLVPPESGLRHPFPSGSAENRRRRRDRERAAARLRWEDRSAFGQVTCWIDWTRFSGDLVARPERGRAVLEVIP